MSEQKLLLFRKWDTTEIQINDIGLKTATYDGVDVPRHRWAL